MQGVILAAGQGKRLWPITRHRSKAMAPVLGKPIVERVMEHLVANGIDDLVLVVSPDDDGIRCYFEGECRLKARVRLAYQAERLGMGRALEYAAPLIDDDFILSACDNLISAEHVGRLMAAMQAGDRANGALTLIPIEPERRGTVALVEMDGPWVTRIVEKAAPGQVDSTISSLPLYAFSRQILDYLPQVPLSQRGEYELQDAIQMLIQGAGRVRGVMVQRRLTLTRPADLLAINRHYLQQDDEPPLIAPLSLGANTRLVAPLRVEPGAIIGRDCILGPNVYVEGGGQVSDGVRIQNALVLRGASVPDGADIEGEVIA